MYYSVTASRYSAVFRGWPRATRSDSSMAAGLLDRTFHLVGMIQKILKIQSETGLAPLAGSRHNTARLTFQPGIHVARLVILRLGQG